ncbi:MAG: 30S ribosomal protein S12 methylthiotransferase RimO [Acidimicrobiia bacterium]
MDAPTVWLETLGCAKNQVDSDKLTVMLATAGYRSALSAEAADVVMVNTSAFIEAARRESVETILELQDAKRPDARTVVLGCMAQRFGVEVEEALPEVDAVLGLDRYADLIGTLDGLTGWRPVEVRRRPAMDILHQVRRPTPNTPYAYVKAAEGCNKPCTFCAIPLIRGKQRSRLPDNIRREVEGLAGDGVSEVVLVAQDLAAFGRDIGTTTGITLNCGDAPRGIVELVRLLSEVPGVRRLRLLYLYPKEIRPALIEEMAGNPAVAAYFDLSLQHAAGPLLRAMRRPGDGGRHLELIEQIRGAGPDAALRSSFIVGFPGEREDDVETLAAFLEEARLDWAGFFPYSAEEGTPAALLPCRVDEEAVAERLRYLQGIQDEITAEAGAAQVGRELEVLVDQVEEGVPVGRSYREAPEIDGMITLDAGSPGEWVRVEVTGAYGPDLAAVVTGTM